MFPDYLNHLPADSPDRQDAQGKSWVVYEE